MRTRTSTWFECKIRYDKMMEDGMQKKITELYVVDALSFTEAESSIIDEMSAYISGEFEVRDIKKAPYGEIFFSEDASADRFSRQSSSSSLSTKRQRRRSAAT